MTKKDSKNSLLQKLPSAAVQHARFLLGHILPPPGSTIMHRHSDDGAVSAALALYAPEVEIIAVNPDKRAVNKAQKAFDLPRLIFQASDNVANNVLDAVIHDFTFHDIYAAAGRKTYGFHDVLREDFARLKDGGLLLLHNFVMPDQADQRYVLLEMPESTKYADLLKAYAQKAYKETGFFLDQLPARYPGTSLFRLSHKNAYEFLMRLETGESDLTAPDKDYAFFTAHDYRRLFQDLEARLLYSTPCADPHLTALQEKQQIRLYDEDIMPLDVPARSFLALGQKISTGQAPALVETYVPPEKTAPSALTLNGFRHLTSGQLVDLVGPANAEERAQTEILPYFIDKDDALYIYLERAVPRPLVNSVPRNGKALFRQWAGYLSGLPCLPDHVFNNVDQTTLKGAVLFARDHLGLKPAPDALLAQGPSFFPHPAMIDRRISSLYLEVRPRDDPRLRACRATDILAALECGFIPAGRLRAQIIALFEHLNRPIPAPLTRPTETPAPQSVPILYARDITLRLSIDNTGYRPARGSGGSIQIMTGCFAEGPHKTQAISFALPTETAMDRALILPLACDDNGALLAGFTSASAPVPPLFGEESRQLTLPSFALPRDIDTPDQARHYIAGHYAVDVRSIAPLGSRFFAAPDLTPLRFIPFALTTVPPRERPDAYAPLTMLWDILGQQTSDERLTSLLAAARQTYESDEVTP